MLTAEKAGIGGIGRGVSGFKDEVFAGVYQIFFFLGEPAPKKKNNVFFFVG